MVFYQLLDLFTYTQWMIRSIKRSAYLIFVLHTKGVFAPPKVEHRPNDSEIQLFHRFRKAVIQSDVVSILQK